MGGFRQIHDEILVETYTIRDCIFHCNVLNYIDAVKRERMS